MSDIRQMTTRLKSFGFTTVVLLGGMFVANAQTKPEANALGLSTVIISRAQLRNGTLEMKLQLRFTNSGRRPLILHRRSLLLIEIGVFEDVEHPTIDTFAEVSAMDYVPHPYSSIRYQRLVRASPGKEFIILLPRRAFDMVESVTAPRRRGNQLADGRGDRYLLTVKVATWDISRQHLASKLRRKWHRFGQFWSETVESEPMAFSVGE